MHGRISDIYRHAVPAIFLLNSFEVLRHLIESLVPLNLLPSSAGPSHRPFESIRIVVDILQSNGFRANVAMAEHIVSIAFNAQRSIWLRIDLNTTHCFADIASSEMGF